MKTVLNSLPLKVKIVGNALILLLFLAGSAIYAYVAMTDIGKELIAITDQDIPMTQALTKVTEHQLEQAIHMERAVSWGILMAQDPSAKKKFVKETEYFDKLNSKVDTEIMDAEQLAEKAIVNAHTHEEKVEFEHILEVLKKIEVEHKTFAKHGHEVFEFLKVGDTGQAAKLMEIVAAEEDQLTRVLEGLLEEIEAFTASAGLRALEHEQQAAATLMVSASIALAVGLVLSIWIAANIIAV